ncbi:MAG: HEPN domain-containing protein, partial [Candidatus Desantisbacteria bacterium]
MYKDLIEKYLLNAEEKLSVAEYLLIGKFYKDSISRSYYSMFFAAKALLATKEIYPESHKG